MPQTYMALTSSAYSHHSALGRAFPRAQIYHLSRESGGRHEGNIARKGWVARVTALYGYLNPTIRNIEQHPLNDARELKLECAGVFPTQAHLGHNRDLARRVVSPNS
jgi:hypothetical protein